MEGMASTNKFVYQYAVFGFLWSDRKNLMRMSDIQWIESRNTIRRASAIAVLYVIGILASRDLVFAVYQYL